METFFSIIGIIALFIFGKFIYDTYLTNNTDREWAKYKFHNPEDAARIENSRGLDFSSKPSIPEKVNTKGSNTVKKFEKQDHTKLLISSFLIKVAERETHQLAIARLEYIKNKNEPDNEEKGYYLIFPRLSMLQSIGSVPVGVINTQADAVGVRKALSYIVDSTVEFQFAPVGSEINNGTIVDEAHEDCYITYAKFTFTERMKKMAAKIEAGIEINEDSNMELLDMDDPHQENNQTRDAKSEKENASIEQRKKIIQNYSATYNDDSDIYNGKGREKYERGDLIAAIQDFDKALDINPDNYDALYNRGRAKYDMGDPYFSMDWLEVELHVDSVIDELFKKPKLIQISEALGRLTMNQEMSVLLLIKTNIHLIKKYDDFLSKYFFDYLVILGINPNKFDKYCSTLKIENHINNLKLLSQIQKKFLLITLVEMILSKEKISEAAVLNTIFIFEQIGCLPSMVGSTMVKMSNGNPLIMRFFSQGKFQQTK